MKHLPLYQAPPKAAVFSHDPLNCSRHCTRCALSGNKSLRNPCLNPEGEVGGLLVVGDAPIQTDDHVGRPFASTAAQTLRGIIDDCWGGKVAYDVAVKCTPGRGDDVAKSVDACRNYLHQTLLDVAPTRIFAFGSQAAKSLMGRSITALYQRRSYAYTSVPYSQKPVPIFFFPNAGFAMRNRFLRAWLEEDIKWASKVSTECPPWDSTVHIVETERDARAAIDYVSSFYRTAWDVETAGLMYDPSFRVVSLAMSAEEDDSRDAFLWPSEALSYPGTAEPLRRWFADPLKRKSGQNVKFDVQATAIALGVWPRGVEADSRLMMKLLDPEADADLAAMSEAVGMGGMKLDNKHAKEAGVKRVRAILSSEKKYAKALASPKAKLPPLPEPMSTLGVWPELEKVIRHADVKTDAWVYGVLDTVSRDTMHAYNARDAVATASLCTAFEAKLNGMPPIRSVWDKLTCRASDAIAQIEAWGMPVDREAIEVLDKHLEMQETAAKMVLDGYFPNVNWNSPPQLRKVLFEDLKLPSVKLTESEEESTDKEVLKVLADKHPMIPALIEFRAMTKLRGAFSRGMYGFIRADGRIHPSILLDGTVTGRSSCVRKGTLVDVVRDVSSYPNGVPIEEVREGDLAYCYTDNGKLALRKVQRVWCTGVRELVRVSWRGSGHKHCGYVDLTPEHLVKTTHRGWVKASDLAPGDRVYALKRGVRGGYSRLWVTGDVEISREHRMIYEHVHGRSAAHVHHVNGNKLDNRVSNLEGMTASDHLAKHGAATSESLRLFRSGKMRAQHAAGSMRAPKGDLAGRWLGLTKAEVEALLAGANWSITHAAKAGGYDFDTFKRYVVRHGIDLGALKRKNRAGRDAQIKASAAHARSSKLVNNHEITSVTYLNESDAVYDLTVEGEHNFIAGEICVHNCKEPNLQQIPRARKDAPAYKMVKDIFRARPGYWLVQADFSQLELRVAAILSKDKDMCDIFKSGVDYHLRTAQMLSKAMWGVEMTEEWMKANEELTKEYRSLVKPVNFGILYGKTAGTLAADMSQPGKPPVSRATAQAVVDAIFGQFKGLKAWCTNQLREGRKTGEAWTEWEGERARRRFLWDIASQTDGDRITAENGTVNCLDAETEALTQRGWVRGFDLRADDVLLTKNSKTGALEWQGMTDLKLWPDYDGEVYEFRSRSFHAVTTPEHRWLVVNKATMQDEERTSNTLSMHGDHRIHRTGNYSPEVSSAVTLDEAEILGWFLTDGSICKPRNTNPRRKDHRHGPRVLLFQSPTGNPEKHARINELVRRLDPTCETKVYTSKKAHGQTTWRLGQDLSKRILSLAPNRVLTMDLMLSLDRPCLERVREAMLLGDGSSCCGKTTLCTSTLEKAEAFQVLCTLTGNHASISKKDGVGRTPMSPKMANVPKCGVSWIVTILGRHTAQVTRAQTTKRVGPCPVWCPVVPNTFFVARRSGHVFITGNTPVQGSASDFCTASIVAIVDWIRQTKVPAVVCVSVHDSIIAEVKEGYVEQVAENMKMIMESWWSGGVPIVADLEVGKSWGSLAKYKDWKAANHHG